jgi:hypothetical protein
MPTKSKPNKKSNPATEKSKKSEAYIRAKKALSRLRSRN